MLWLCLKTHYHRQLPSTLSLIQKRNKLVKERLSLTSMKTDVDTTLWAFSLVPKLCEAFMQPDVATAYTFLLLMALAWLSISLIYWVHPGGPAWGKYCFSKRKPSSFGNFSKPIPGPRGLPLFGSIKLMANQLAHRQIAAAAQSHGARRLMAFSLGQTRVIVTCDADVAKEILQSPVFADRPMKESARGLMFNRAIGFAPCNDYWRVLRRIAGTHFFCPNQIKATEDQRRAIASGMVSLLGHYNYCQPFTVHQVLKRASLHNMMFLVFGRRYELDHMNEEAEELKRLVDEGYELLGTLNWSDHFSWLSDFDPQNIRARCWRLLPKVKVFVSRMIAEHRETTGDGDCRDFVDVLLSLQSSDKLSDLDIVAVLWEMIFRGTDTVAILIEWILARMVLHPEVQSRVQNELDEVVGKHHNVLNEGHMAQMVYLKAVVKEVLRLHPPGPLLSWARLAAADTLVNGHHVPAGTTAMVDMWAISRDPKVWEDPHRFMPERFVSGKEGGVEFSVLGSDLRLAPFGSGRRSCPGKSLGMITVTHWVAHLLLEYEWLPSASDRSNGVDLTEVLRLSCEMAYPLTVIVRPRRRAPKY